MESEQKEYVAKYEVRDEVKELAQSALRAKENQRNSAELWRSKFKKPLGKIPPK